MDFTILLDRLVIKGSTTTLTAYPIGRVIFDHTAETKCQSCIPFLIAFLLLLFIFSHLPVHFPPRRSFPSQHFFLNGQNSSAFV